MNMAHWWTRCWIAIGLIIMTTSTAIQLASYTVTIILMTPAESLTARWMFSMMINGDLSLRRIAYPFGISLNGCNIRRDTVSGSRQWLSWSCFTIISRGHLVCVCQFDYDCRWRLWLIMILWWWRLGLMITIWLQWFDDDDDIYAHDEYVDEQHAYAKVQLSKTCVYRVYLPNRYFFDGFHHRVYVFYLSRRGCFHYELSL